MKYLLLFFSLCFLDPIVQLRPHKNVWEDISQAFSGHHDDEGFVCYPRAHRNFYFSFTFLIVMATGATFYGFRIKQKSNRKLALQNEEINRQKREIEAQRDQLMALNEEINQQKEEIMAQRDDIEEKSVALQEAFLEIEKKNDDIISSINYAQRIQQAMLPNLEHISAALPESFVFFKPRDIVSGDFYWFSEVTCPEGHRKMILAAADCTGHGVPGAFMSMIGNDLLSEIINERGVTEPEKILGQLHDRVRKVLRQHENESRDGMDIALCVIDTTRRTLEFAGAKNPLYLVLPDEQGQPQLIEIKGDKNPIGGFQKETERVFRKHIIQLPSQATFYLFSDGYQDQFGGVEGRKFMTRRFRELLFSIHHEPMHVQKHVLEEQINTWMGWQHTQLDDIMVIGVRV